MTFDLGKILIFTKTIYSLGVRAKAMPEANWRQFYLFLEVFRKFRIMGQVLLGYYLFESTQQFSSANTINASYPRHKSVK